MRDVYSMLGQELPNQGINIVGIGACVAHWQQAVRNMLKRNSLHSTHRDKDLDEKS